MDGFSHTLRAIGTTSQAMRASSLAKLRICPERKFDCRVQWNLPDPMTGGAGQVVPQPCSSRLFLRAFVLTKSHKQGNAYRAGALFALQPMQKRSPAVVGRVRNPVACVKSATRPEHRVVSDVLASMANCRNRPNLDLAGIRIAEGRSNPVIRQQDRLPAPRTDKAAMRH